MIIFRNEERAYLSWIAHHRNGFVLDWRRKPTRKQPVIHRATCELVRSSKTKRSHHTTGRHVKACALDVDELTAWAHEESAEALSCDRCQPHDESASAAPRERHLTKLGKEIVDFVVEAAVIHLDRHDSDYEMTVADVAACLDKTPGQVSPALVRLAEDGYLRLGGQPAPGASLTSGCKIFPTADALRTLPAFGKMPRRKVEQELDSLSDDA